METPSSTNPHASAAPDNESSRIYHIARLEAWEAALYSGLYLGDTLAAEGFIHCSKRGQLAGSANRFFHGHTGLVLLEIDPLRLQSRLVFEASASGEDFPHIYGPLQVEAVVKVTPFSAGPDGWFVFP